MSIARRQDIKGSYISYFSNLVKSHGGINLAQGVPGFDPPSGLLTILGNIKAQKEHQYAPGTGHKYLLEQLKDLYQDKYDPEKSNFFVVNGATEAISLIYTMLFRRYKSDLKVLALSPAYESYIYLPSIFNNDLYCEPLESSGKINIDRIEEIISTRNIKLMFICSPGNPWGTITGKDEMRSVLRICEAHKCYVIIDSVYREIYFSKEAPWYPTESISEYIFYVNSFSKLFSITGWRIGYLLSHIKNMADLKSVHDYIGLSSPTPLQIAIAQFLRDNRKEADKYISGLRETIALNYKTQSKRLSDHGFKIPIHDGGYFIWACCPDEISNDMDFAIDLYNCQKTAIIPGSHFGREWDRFIRINIALPPEILDRGIKSICKYIS